MVVDVHYMANIVSTVLYSVCGSVV